MFQTFSTFPSDFYLLLPGLTISFSGEIPVIGGNGIPFRNFGDFRRISVNFGRFFLNFEFSKQNFPKIPKYFFPVPSGNEKFRRNSAKFRQNFKPCERAEEEDWDTDLSACVCFLKSRCAFDSVSSHLFLH